MLLDRNRDIAVLWADLQDRLVPSLRLRPGHLAVYLYLLRQTHLLGRRDVEIPYRMLARGAGVGEWSARGHIRTLVLSGCLVLRDTRHGSVRLEVRLPNEVLTPALPPPRLPGQIGSRNRTPAFRMQIFRRDRGRCFYCRKKLRRGAFELDHIIPLARAGTRELSNLVAVCRVCNRRKSTRLAGEFLRILHRRGHLTRRQLHARLSALRRMRSRRSPPHSKRRYSMSAGSTL